MSRDSMSGTHDSGGDAAAYVLGALDPDELEAFRRHLSECAVCRDEVASLQHTVDALPMAAPQLDVPRGLRRRVLAEVRAEAAGGAKAAGGEKTKRRSRSSLPRPAIAAAALAAIAVAVFVGVELSSGGSGGVRVYRAQVGDAQVRVSDGQAELIVHKLRQPPPGRIYEVWLKRGAAPPSPTRALFSVTKAGDGNVAVPGNLHGVTTVMVTQERAGGSPHPTTQPVVVTSLG
jgi:anti-sigma-K factor RskA